MSTTINFTKDVPRLGSSMVVQEGVGDLANCIDQARTDEQSFVEATKPDGKSVLIPIDLIGPMEDRSQ